jgi:hypothetical protein
MQALVQNNETDRPGIEAQQRFARLFDRFWDDVQHLNNYSPEAARALLRLEGDTERGETLDLDGPAFDDPWTAVRVGLRERAAG